MSASFQDPTNTKRRRWNLIVSCFGAYVAGNIGNMLPDQMTSLKGSFLDYAKEVSAESLTGADLARLLTINRCSPFRVLSEHLFLKRRPYGSPRTFGESAAPSNV